MKQWVLVFSRTKTVILISDTSFISSQCMKDKVGSTSNPFGAALKHDQHLHGRRVFLPSLIIFITQHTAYKWPWFFFTLFFSGLARRTTGNLHVLLILFMLWLKYLYTAVLQGLACWRLTLLPAFWSPCKTCVCVDFIRTQPQEHFTQFQASLGQFWIRNLLEICSFV